MSALARFIPFLLPLGLLFFLLWRFNRRITMRQERVPATLKLLRPPGESLRVKLEVLDEKLSDQLLLAVTVPIGFGVAAAMTATPHALSDLLLIVVACVCVWVFGSRALRTVEERRCCRLGFHGERACGELLNQLMLEGCRVFHDVPNDPYGNIDHVIVAPSGIYAVETKTRRMRKMPQIKLDHVATSDGKTVHFPFGSDAAMCEQAQQQASALARFLSSAIAEPIKVRPIVALPGWYVRRTSNRGVPVVNPKSVRTIVIDRKKPQLDSKVLLRAAHQLDQRCRDVSM